MSEGGVGLVVREALEAARALEAEHRRGYYARLEQVASLERLGAAQDTGDLSTERLIQDMWRIDPCEAGRLRDESADLTPRFSLQGQVLPPRLPATAMVLAAGEIGAGHVVVIRRAMKRLDKVEGLDPDQWRRAEAYLADKATLFPPKKLEALAKALLDKLDPDGAAPDEDAGLFDDLKMTSCRDGSLEMRIKIHDAVDAEMIREGVGVLSTPTGAEDHRSLGHRQACALKEVFADALGPHGLVTDTRDDEGAGDTRAGGTRDGETGEGDPAEDALIPEPRRPEPAKPAGEPVRGPGRPLLTITMDQRWLRLAVGHGTLDSGALVDAATVRRWACDAEIVPMVLGSRSEPLDIGRRSRLVPDAMRRALTFRDRGCAFPGCTRRPRRCEAHHVDHWGNDGPTALDNLTLLCRHHHQVIHHGHWTVQMIDGLPVVHPATPGWTRSEDPDPADDPPPSSLEPQINRRSGCPAASGSRRRRCADSVAALRCQRPGTTRSASPSWSVSATATGPSSP